VRVANLLEEDLQSQVLLLPARLVVCVWVKAVNWFGLTKTIRDVIKSSRFIAQDVSASEEIRERADGFSHLLELYMNWIVRIGGVGGEGRH
jgi:hypothetical protein